jgi:hypothetical protein
MRMLSLLTNGLPQNAIITITPQESHCGSLISPSARKESFQEDVCARSIRAVGFIILIAKMTDMAHLLSFDSIDSNI